MLGQGARAAIGLKGMADDAKALDLSPNDLFETARLITSIVIGFLVGMAAALAYAIGHGAIPTDLATNYQILIGFIAAGYVGTDFLEGFIAQYLPQGAPGTAAQKATAQKVAAQTADYAVKAAALSQLPCGYVNHGVAPITAQEIKSLVLQCYATLPGANPHPNPKTPDSTPISALMGPPDPVYTLALACEKFGRFNTDGLMCQRPYFEVYGQTLGGFVQCIQCCYNHPKAA
jgi:hypothetical protein